MNTNFVCYYRVSTTQQGQSGLGLEAQRQSVRDYAQKVQGTILDELVEVESGKRSDRPVLTDAIQRCRQTGATLLVAKLDRLSRNLHLLIQDCSLDLLCVIPDGLALSLQPQTTLTLLGGTDPVVANKVGVHVLLATGILMAIKRNLTGPNGSDRTICSFVPVSSSNCHFLYTPNGFGIWNRSGW